MLICSYVLLVIGVHAANRNIDLCSYMWNILIITCYDVGLNRNI